jgi:HSP20 family protein
MSTKRNRQTPIELANPKSIFFKKEQNSTMAIDLWRTRPYSAYNTPLRQWVDRVFDDAFAREGGQNGGSASAGFQSLPVNVWETPEGYQAALLAPGLDEQSINVTVHDETLAIEGELQFSVPEGSKAVWQEFGPSKFRRSLRLGSAVDPARVEAIYRNGLLLVTMPKAEHAKPRQIQVQVNTNTEAMPAGKK